MKIKQFELALLQYDEIDKILFCQVKQDQVVDVSEINELIEYVKEFVGETPHFALTDFGGTLQSTSEARAIYAKSEYIIRNRIADALLVKSLGDRIIANFFVRVSKPKIPTHIFNNKQRALDWLKQFSKD